MSIQPREYQTIEYYPDSVAVYCREYYHHCRFTMAIPCQEIRNS
nr:hypothetical protein [Elizabethkingia sp. ASV34]